MDMIVFTGKEFKQFWADDAFWKNGSLNVKNSTVSVLDKNCVRVSDPQEASEIISDDVCVTGFKGIVYNIDGDGTFNLALDLFAKEWRKVKNSVTYRISFERNSEKEKEFEFLLRQHGFCGLMKIIKREDGTDENTCII